MSDKNNQKPKLVVIQNSDEKTQEKLNQNNKAKKQSKKTEHKKQPKKTESSKKIEGSKKAEHTTKKTKGSKPKKTVKNKRESRSLLQSFFAFCHIIKSGIIKFFKFLGGIFVSIFKKFSIKKLILLVIAVLIIAGITYIAKSDKIEIINKNDNLYTKEFGVNSKADFYVLNKNVFYCTKDIATLLDANGNSIWSDTLSMVSPSLMGEGNFVGVADIKNKLLNVYNETGKVYSIEAEGNITSFAINKLGATAIICKNSNDSDYNVSVYNSTGQKMFMGSYVSKDGIPMSVDINDDSSKVAVGFINVGNLNLSSKILFYSTDKAVAAKIENSDAMFAAVNCDKEMVGCIKFLDDDSCIIATDKSLSNIGGTSVAAYEQNWKMDFTNYVTALNVVGSDYVAVAYGDKLEASDEDIRDGSVYWYNTKNGNVKGSTQLKSTVSKLSSGLGITLAELEDNTYLALKPSGVELWSYDGVQTINNILFYNNTDTIVVVASNHMTIADVRKGVNNTEQESTAQDGKDTSKESTPKENTQQTTAQQTTQATTKEQN